MAIRQVARFRRRSIVTDRGQSSIPGIICGMSPKHGHSDPRTWFDLAAVFVLVFGLSLFIWSDFVAAWILVGIAGLRIVLSVALRGHIRNRKPPELKF